MNGAATKEDNEASRPRRPSRILIYDRKSSNNSARLRLWFYLRRKKIIADGITTITLKSVTHEEQREPYFQRVNPFQKIPALAIYHDDDEPALCLSESSVMLEYLEQSFSPNDRPGLIPASPEKRAVMNLIIRSHDLYLSSPNCTQNGNFTHTQGCMYVPPPGSEYATTRWIARQDRATKLAEIWKQLDVLEDFMRGPFFVGGELTLADLTVYPTFLFFVFFLPRVFGWDGKDAVFFNRPKLREWFDVHMEGIPEATVVKEELMEALNKVESNSGVLKEIKEETRDKTYKWVYP